MNRVIEVKLDVESATTAQIAVGLPYSARCVHAAYCLRCVKLTFVVDESVEEIDARTFKLKTGPFVADDGWVYVATAQEGLTLWHVIEYAPRPMMRPLAPIAVDVHEVELG